MVAKRNSDGILVRKPEERDPWVALMCINGSEVDFIQSRVSGGLLYI